MAMFQPFAKSNTYRAPRLADAAIEQKKAEDRIQQMKMRNAMGAVQLYNKAMGDKTPIGDTFSDALRSWFPESAAGEAGSTLAGPPTALANEGAVTAAQELAAQELAAAGTAGTTAGASNPMSYAKLSNPITASAALIAGNEIHRAGDDDYGPMNVEDYLKGEPLKEDVARVPEKLFGNNVNDIIGGDLGDAVGGTLDTGANVMTGDVQGVWDAGQDTGQAIIDFLRGLV